MKFIITGTATLVICSFLFAIYTDMNLYGIKREELRFVCEELSATGSLFQDDMQYSNGLKVFNQTEANKAVAAQIKVLLGLNDSFAPLPTSYWTDIIKYRVYYFDDSNTVYPYLFVDADTSYSCTITEPTVVVTITAGKPRFRFPAMVASVVCKRSASHAWTGRK